MGNGKSGGRKKEDFKTWFKQRGQSKNDHKREVVRTHCIKQLPEKLRQEAAKLSTTDLYQRALDSVPKGEEAFLDELKDEFRKSRPKSIRVFGKKTAYSSPQIKLPKKTLKAMDGYIKRKNGLSNRTELIVSAFDNLEELDKGLRDYYKEWEKDIERNTQQRVDEVIRKKDNEIINLKQRVDELSADETFQKEVQRRTVDLLFGEIRSLYSRLESYEDIFDVHGLDYRELNKSDNTEPSRGESEVKRLESRIDKLFVAEQPTKTEEMKYSEPDKKRRRKPSSYIPMDLARHPEVKDNLVSEAPQSGKHNQRDDARERARAQNTTLNVDGSAQEKGASVTSEVEELSEDKDTSS